MTFPRFIAAAGVVLMIGGAYAYGHFGKSPWHLVIATFGLLMFISAPHINARGM